LSRFFEEAGVPHGVLNLILGAGAEIGEEIANHPAVKAVSFTGSTEVGHKTLRAMRARGAKVQCEMGGKNPVVVMEDCDMDLAVESTAQGAFGSTGQRCTATSRAVVIDRIRRLNSSKNSRTRGKVRIARRRPKY
jgi:aldehyde dehydrogenase (NAD+)